MSNAGFDERRRGRRSCTRHCTLACAIAAWGVVAHGGAPAGAATILAEGVTAGAAGRIDRAAAVPSPGLRITSAADGAVIPRNHAFPLFEWSAPPEGEGPFLLELRGGGEELLVFTAVARWRPAGREFEPLLSGDEALATVYRLEAGRTVRSGTVRIAVDGRPLSDRIVFREVQPLFNPALPNALREFAFGRRELRTVLAPEGTCVGCHGYGAGAAAFSVKRGGQRRLVTARRIGGAFRLDSFSPGEFSFFSFSPNGAQAVFVSSPLGDLALRETLVEPFDFPYRSGDIRVLDLATGAEAPLPGASEPGWVEDMPALSPDGERLVFVRYRGAGEGMPGIDSMELWQVPFNGGRGGAAVPLLAAAPDARWSYFPRFSPDGRWLSFCRGDATRGVYARRSSEIHLLALASGAVTRLNLNAEGAMDSWHAWSSDSRWLAFSSNREPGGLTALYLSLIGEDGTDAPPVKLLGLDGMKVNTPQFIPEGLDLESLVGLEDFLDEVYARP